MGDFLSTTPYRGTRDFLPEELSVRTQVFQRMYECIERFGYQRYDGPLLEPVEIYERKSGQELVNEQVYKLTDRKGRVLVLRPEMTPSVARMIAGNKGRLTMPARWYSHVNCHRYERPQKGRLREHWQINVDVFGSESMEAEIEIFHLIHELLCGLGANSSDYGIRVSDRVLMEGALIGFVEVKPSSLRAVLHCVDRWEKVPFEATVETLTAAGLGESGIERLRELLGLPFDGFLNAVNNDYRQRSHLPDIMASTGSDVPLVFDPLIVRGFDYYTTTVFEVFDMDLKNRRSIAGGGRYDNLIEIFDKEKISGIGFGMGDVTLFHFLETRGLLPKPDIAPHVTVISMDQNYFAHAREIGEELRNQGWRVVAPLIVESLKKSLRKAAGQGSAFAVLIAEDEFKRGHVILRNMNTRQQVELPAEKLAESIRESSQFETVTSKAND